MEHAHQACTALSVTAHEVVVEDWGGKIGSDTTRLDPTYHVTDTLGGLDAAFASRGCACTRSLVESSIDRSERDALSYRLEMEMMGRSGARVEGDFLA